VVLGVGSGGGGGASGGNRRQGRSDGSCWWLEAE